VNTKTGNFIEKHCFRSHLRNRGGFVDGEFQTVRQGFVCFTFAFYGSYVF